MAKLQQGSGELIGWSAGAEKSVSLALDDHHLKVAGAALTEPQYWRLDDIETVGTHLSQVVRRISNPLPELKLGSTYFYDLLADRAPHVAVRSELVPEITRDWKAKTGIWQSQSLNLWRFLWVGPEEQRRSYHDLMHMRRGRLVLYFIGLAGLLITLWIRR